MVITQKVTYVAFSLHDGKATRLLASQANFTYQKKIHPRTGVFVPLDHRSVNERQVCSVRNEDLRYKNAEKIHSFWELETALFPKALGFLLTAG